MRQSTENIVKDTKYVNLTKKRRRKRRRTKRLISGFCIVLIILFFMLGIFWGVRHISKKDAQNLTVGDLFSSDDIQKPELPLPEYEISITVSVVGDCTLGTDELFNYATSLNAYYTSRGPE